MAVVVLGLSLLLIVHGSLFPWRFVVPYSWAQGLQRLLLPESLSTSWGDLIGNVLLFMPLAAAGGWLMRQKSWAWRVGVIGAGGALLGLALQVVQLALPMRTAALSDALWNAVGLGLGLALAHRMAPVMQGLAQASRTPHRGAWCAAGLWLLIQWWPFLPGLSLHWIRMAVFQWVDMGLFNAHAAIVEALGVVLLVHALRAMPARAGWALGLLLLAALGKLGFAYTLPLSLSACALGWAGGLAAGMLTWSVRQRVACWWVLGACAAALLITGLQGSWGPALVQPNPVQWWPFRSAFGSYHGHFHAHYSHGLLLMAFTLGGLGVQALRLGARPALLWPALTLVLAVLEWAQRHWPGQQADVTVLLLPWLCAWVLGHTLRRGWWRDSV